MESREDLARAVRQTIRNIPDFPKPGILFRDITPVLRDGELFRKVCLWLCGLVEEAKAQVICGVESRGFIFAAPVAAMTGRPLALVRKPGKLPWHKRCESYELEYGTDKIEMHEDAVMPSERVALIDDLLATGGTAEAVRRLVEGLGGQVVLAAFVVELLALEGRKRLPSVQVEALVGF